MEKLKGLNANEIKVLKAIYDDSMDCSGGDFAMTDEIFGYVKGLTKNQVKGYVSDLQKKGIIYTWNTIINNENVGQITCSIEGDNDGFNNIDEKFFK